MLKEVFSVCFSLVILAISSTNGNIYVNITGDIIIGGLFPIHGKGSNGQNCGDIQLEDGIQPLEAMLYTLQQINRNPHILPGIQLGALAFDTCDSPSYALEQTLNFVKGFIAHTNEFHAKEFRCNDQSVPRFLAGGFDKVVAVLGPQSSSVTIQVASILALFSVPQISYMATSPFLSSKERFPHFFRTVPSDVNQARAMLEILRRFHWSYVSVVYSDTEYGDHGYQTLVSLASEYSICFSAPHRISEEYFALEDYDNVVRTIAEKTEVRVVVLFAEKSTTIRVLEAAKRIGVGDRFVWIGSDSWSASHYQAANYRSKGDDGEEVVALEGALAVQPLYRKLSGFDEYFTNLTRDHCIINPWFSEFWQVYHSCQDNNPGNVSLHKKPGASQKSAQLNCSDPRLKISSNNGYKQRNLLHFVRDAVYSVAYALRALQKDRCGEHYRGICKEMRHIDGPILSQYIANVTFKDEAGKRFSFDNSVDGPPRYTILNYQKSRSGIYSWVIVGNYTLNDEGEPVLRLDRGAMKFRDGFKDYPNSSCSAPCGPDRIMVRVKQDPCCWRCQSCGLYRYKVDEQRCEECEWGTKPVTDGRGGCIPIPEEYVDYSNPWAIVAMTFAICGMGLTGFVFSVFWIYRETPVIKACGRELSFLLLLGTLASFAMTFAVVAKPTNESCAVARFGIGFCYTLCYAALATKTNRIHRIFNDTARSPRKRRYTSPKSQLVIAMFLTLLQVLIDVSWLLKVPPTVTQSYPTRETNIRICRGSDDGSYVVGLVYPFLLTVACTVYAIKTRKCPEGFNETRRIAFANYATIILWLAFVPLYLASTNNSVRVITLALSLSLNGLVQLLCLFFPKVYVVLVKPEKNTRELVMSRHRTMSYPTTPATPEVLLDAGPFVFRTDNVTLS